MASRTISLREEAYRRLKALKTGEKSFSDVVMELTEHNPGNFTNLAGVEVYVTAGELIENRRREDLTDEGREELLR